MIVAVSATVMAVLKKVLAFLLGDKKGRKFLGYTIGIVLFIALLPVIAIYGLFGWMSGNDAAGIIGYDAVYEKLPTEIREQINANSAQLDMIEIVFCENGLTDEDITKAKLIYLKSTMRKTSMNDWQNASLQLVRKPICSQMSLLHSALISPKQTDNNSTTILEVDNYEITSKIRTERK